MPHNKHQRSLFHGSKQPLYVRQELEDDSANPYNDPGDEGDPFDDGSSRLFLTGPITIRITRTITETLETATESPILTNTASTEPTMTSSSFGAVTSKAAEASSSPAPSVTRSSAGATELDNSQVPQPVAGSSKSDSGLPSGAVIGLVVAALALVIGVTVYFVRRRYVQKRIRLRKEWTRSKPVSTSSGSQHPPTESAPPFPVSDMPIYNSFSRPQEQQYIPINTRRSPEMATRNPVPVNVASLPPLSIPPPPTSYGTEYTAVYPHHNRYALSSPTSRSTSPAKKLLTPLYGPPSAVLTGPTTAIIVSTFITTLPDELHIAVGETVRMLSEFDDGWALCVNSRSEQGMVPLECLDRGLPLNTEYITRTFGGNLKRISSLQPNVVRGARF